MHTKHISLQVQSKTVLCLFPLLIHYIVSYLLSVGLTMQTNAFKSLLVRVRPVHVRNETALAITEGVVYTKRVGSIPYTGG